MTVWDLGLGFDLNNIPGLQPGVVQVVQFGTSSLARCLFRDRMMGVSDCIFLKL